MKWTLGEALIPKITTHDPPVVWMVVGIRMVGKGSPVWGYEDGTQKCDEAISDRGILIGRDDGGGA